MSGFRFRLDGLLRLHRQSEDTARQELAHAQRRVQNARDGLDALVVARAQAGEDVGQARQGGEVSALQAGHAHVQRLRHMEALSREELAALEQHHALCREEALTAHRRRETLQRLHDQSLERYLAALRRDDARQADEAGTMQAARRVIMDRPEGRKE